jgi:hypothetical protein
MFSLLQPSVFYFLCPRKINHPPGYALFFPGITPPFGFFTEPDFPFTLSSSGAKKNQRSDFGSLSLWLAKAFDKVLLDFTPLRAG